MGKIPPVFRTKFRIHKYQVGLDTWYEVSEKPWYWPVWDKCCVRQLGVVLPLMFQNHFKAKRYILFRQGKSITDLVVEYL